MVHGAEESLRHVMRMVEERALIYTVATAQAIPEGLLKAGYELETIPELFVWVGKSGVVNCRRSRGFRFL